MRVGNDRLMVKTLAAGSRLGPYEVMELLGAGGMGEVYRARDTRLGRQIAIKIVRPSLAADPDMIRRFDKEARAAGALNHPNVVAVYDVGAEGEIRYVVSELLEGSTLRGRLAGGALPVRQCLEYGRQISAGLAEAHDKRIVHRDLKPENVFVTADGRIKILDFGLARMMPSARAKGDPAAPTISRPTEPGVVMGTVGYMAPEQVRGLSADHRADVFAFGAILYEMLTGRRAFQGGSAPETMSAILRDEPPPLSAGGQSFPTGLNSIVGRCLAKNPEERFQSTRDLGFALDTIFASMDTAAPELDASRDVGGRRSVAVLPFKDLAGDPANAHLGLGLADATITELALVRSLLVRPTSSILRYNESRADPVAVGRELAVDTVVDGSFQRAGSRLRVTVQLVGCEDGRPLWATKLDTSLDDIFQMQDMVSRNIAKALELELTPADQRHLLRANRAARPGGEAYDLYMKGKLSLFGGTLEKMMAGVEWFEKARDLDPGFALAWAGLADACSRMAFTYQPEGDWYAQAELACEKALSLDPSLPEARYVRARLSWSPQGGFDHAGAIRDLVPVLGDRPSLVDAQFKLGVILFHLGMLPQAMLHIDQGLAVSPEHTNGLEMRGFCLYLEGRYEAALEATEIALRIGSDDWNHYQAALCLLRLGRLREAEEIADRSRRSFPEGVLAYPVLGLIAARRGNAAEADRQVQLIVTKRKSYGHYHHAVYDMACIHALLGRIDRALSLLTESARDGYPCHPVFENDPFLERLRGEARFARLIDELKSETAGYARLYNELRAAAAGS